MSDTAARRILTIDTQARYIALLEEELERTKKGERPTMSPLTERMIILVVTGALSIGMAWAGVDTKVQNVVLSLSKQEARAGEMNANVRADVAGVRADALYDEAERYFVTGSEEGCTFEGE